MKLTLPSKVNAVRMDSHTTGNVIGFRLGCVVSENDHFLVKYTFEERGIDLPGAYGGDGGDSDPIILFLAIADFAPARIVCERQKAKVAVVGVTFSDGAAWSAKR